MRQALKRLKSNKILLGIVGLAFLIRLVSLAEVPASLYWEEVALGYDAFAVLKTGRDHHGNLLPIIAFESFGDWKPSGYFYALIPFIWLLGLNEVSVRLPSVIAGTLTILVTYMIGREFKMTKQGALASSMILAIMPWHIQFSRAAFEVNLATFYLVTGILLLLKARRESRYLYLSVISMVFSMYTYHGLRLLAPLISGIILILFYKEFKKKLFPLVGAGVLASLMTLPLLLAIRNPIVNQRFQETSFISQSKAVETTNRLREEDGNTLLSRIIHHRYGYYFHEVMANSFRHLEVNFLFLRGDGNLRHQTGYFGLLLPWMGGLMMVFWLRKKTYRDKSSLGLIIWMWLATLPPALTTVSPHTLRFLPASPALALMMGIGAEELLRWVNRQQKKRVISVALSLPIFIITGAYLYDYFLVYPIRSANEWQSGYKELMLYLEPYYDEGKRIHITRDLGRPVMYALFYWQVDPKKVQHQEPQTPQDQGELLGLDQVTFGGEPKGEVDVWVSARERELQSPVKVISNNNNEPVFYVYSKN